MSYKPLKIGKYTIPIPIIQGGMGIGISWDKLAGTVSLNGGLGVISAVGTGYYNNSSYIHKLVANRPYDVVNFYSKEALGVIVAKAREICKTAPLAANILYAINDYGRVVKDACEAGINMIITGAGLPINLPLFTKDYPDVALIPIVSSVRALNLIVKKWAKYDKKPDAIIVEGPLSGGHQGFTYEQCMDSEYALENILPPVVKEANKLGGIPVIAAGGIWDKNDIEKFLALGASGVQMGTRFIGTHECDAKDEFKQVILNSKKEDIRLIKSPVGYPARAVITALQVAIEQKEAPRVKCISNCVAPCNHGEEAKIVGYCIADRLADACLGDTKTGLFFTGANGYRLNEIISVRDLFDKLVHGE